MRTELTDGFVLLRPSEAGDFYHYWEAARESFSEVSLWMGFPWSADAPKEEVRKWYDSVIGQSGNRISFDFSIFDAQDKYYLGHCFVNNITASKRANLGYWVRTSRTGRGVATAAVRLLVPFILKELGLLRIEIIVATGNIASQRVAEKSGATREGILRNRIVVGDRVCDAVMYSIIPSDIL